MSVTTELAFSYEYAVDIDTSDTTTPSWQQIRFISAVDPQVSSVEQDGATYDDLGSPHPIKTSESWTLGFTVQLHRLEDGSFLPEVEKLLELAGPEAVGNSATGHFRWYDNPAAGTPNDSDAFEGYGSVSVTRQNTGNDQIAGLTVTITGQGRRTRIDNPAGDVGGGGGA